MQEVGSGLWICDFEWRSARFGAGSRAEEEGEPVSFPLPFAAGGVSEHRRGRSLPPQERSACASSGSRSRPHPAQPRAGAPAGRRSLAERGATWLWGVESNHQPSG